MLNSVINFCQYTRINLHNNITFIQVSPSTQLSVLSRLCRRWFNYLKLLNSELTRVHYICLLFNCFRSHFYAYAWCLLNESAETCSTLWIIRDIVCKCSRYWRSICFLFYSCITAERLIQRRSYVIDSAGRCKPFVCLYTSKCRLNCGPY